MASLDVGAVWAAIRFGSEAEAAAMRARVQLEIADAGSINKWRIWRGLDYRMAYGLARACGVDAQRRRPPRHVENPLHNVAIESGKVVLQIRVDGTAQPLTVTMSIEAAQEMACDILATAGELEPLARGAKKRARKSTTKRGVES